MDSYRIRFFKTLVGSNGYSAKCLQHVVEIHCAKSAERAVTAAKHRYARDYGVRNWQLYADTFEVEIREDDSRVLPRSARAPRRGAAERVHPAPRGNARLTASVGGAQ